MQQWRKYDIHIVLISVRTQLRLDAYQWAWCEWRLLAFIFHNLLESLAIVVDSSLSFLLYSVHSLWMKLNLLVKFLDSIFDLICKPIVLLNQSSLLIYIIAFNVLNLLFKLTDFKESSKFCAGLLFQFLFSRIFFDFLSVEFNLLCLHLTVKLVLNDLDIAHRQLFFLRPNLLLECFLESCLEVTSRLWRSSYHVRLKGLQLSEGIVTYKFLCLLRWARFLAVLALSFTIEVWSTKRVTSLFDKARACSLRSAVCFVHQEL